MKSSNDKKKNKKVKANDFSAVFHLGFVVSVSGSGDQGFLKVAPLWSGKRAQDQYVIYDTYYGPNDKQDYKIENTEIEVRKKDIVTIAIFDEELNRYLIDTGKQDLNKNQLQKRGRPNVRLLRISQHIRVGRKRGSVWWL